MQLLKGRFNKSLVDNRAALFRLAFSWCHDRALAEDLVQQTVVKALEREHQLRSPAKIKPWLFQILTRCFADHCRARGADCCSDDLGSAKFDPQDLVGRAERVYRVRRAIAGLPLPQRQVLTLVELEALSYREVSDTLEIPIGTVMSRLSRARNALRLELGKTHLTRRTAKIVSFKPEVSRL